MKEEDGDSGYCIVSASPSHASLQKACQVTRIAVISTDGIFSVVSASELNLLLKKKEIRSFLRSDGWVRVGFDALRDSASIRQYDGNDRRKRVNLEKARCSYCGNDFLATSGGSIHSVVVENDGFSIQIVEGELIYGAYHFCSEICMFRRDQGTISSVLLEAELWPGLE